MARPTYWVTPRTRSWAVKLEGGSGENFPPTADRWYRIGQPRAGLEAVAIPPGESPPGRLGYGDAAGRLAGGKAR